MIEDITIVVYTRQYLCMWQGPHILVRVLWWYGSSNDFFTYLWGDLQIFKIAAKQFSWFGRTALQFNTLLSNYSYSCYIAMHYCI